MSYNGNFFRTSELKNKLESNARRFSELPNIEKSFGLLYILAQKGRSCGFSSNLTKDLNLRVLFVGFEDVFI